MRLLLSAAILVLTVPSLFGQDNRVMEDAITKFKGLTKEVMDTIPGSEKAKKAAQALKQGTGGGLPNAGNSADRAQNANPQQPPRGKKTKALAAATPERAAAASAHAPGASSAAAAGTTASGSRGGASSPTTTTVAVAEPLPQRTPLSPTARAGSVAPAASNSPTTGNAATAAVGQNGKGAPETQVNSLSPTEVAAESSGNGTADLFGAGAALGAIGLGLGAWIRRRPQVVE